VQHYAALCESTDNPDMVGNAIDCVANATRKAQLLQGSRSQVSICMCASDDVIDMGLNKIFHCMKCMHWSLPPYVEI